MRRFRAVLTVTCGALAACSSSTASEKSDKGQTPGPDAETIVGKGSFALLTSDTSSSLSGDVVPADAPPTTACTETKIDDACVLRRCEKPSAPQARTYLSAGTITVTGGALPTAGLVAVAASDGRYGGPATANAWKGGEAVTFSGSGSVAPAFAVTVRAPSTRITIIEPALSGDFLDVAKLKRANDLVVSWRNSNAADEGRVTVHVTSADLTSVQCSFAVAKGTGIVRRAGLQQLAAGPATALFNVMSESTTTAGRFEMRAALYTPPHAVTGKTMPMATLSLE